MGKPIFPLPPLAPRDPVDRPLLPGWIRPYRHDREVEDLVEMGNSSLGRIRLLGTFARAPTQPDLATPELRAEELQQVARQAQHAAWVCRNVARSLGEVARRADDLRNQASAELSRRPEP